TIAAGAIDTDMNQAILNDPARKKTVEASIPLGRMGKAEEVAHAIIQLINTGSYITGATIKIDGGWLLKHGFVNPEKYSFGIDKPNKSAQ
ncbi:MAG: SDR family oxidoreductase, partial [Pedobacter sp.]